MTVGECADTILDAIANTEREAIAKFIETWGGHPPSPLGRRKRLADAIRNGEHWNIPPANEDTEVIHTHEIGGEG